MSGDKENEKPEVEKTEAEVLAEMAAAELAALPVIKKPAFIEDGYTVPGYISKIISTDEVGREVGFVEFDFRFKYRPLNTKDRDLWAKVPAKELELYNLNLMSRRISEWNLLDEAGNPYPIQIGNIQRLDPVLSDHLFGLIMGWPGFRNDAELNGADNVGRKAALKSELEALEERELADAKN